METTTQDSAQRSQTWVITEHRQITVECSHPFVKADAMRLAFDGSQPSYIVSDHTRRDIYPVSGPVVA